MAGGQSKRRNSWPRIRRIIPVLFLALLAADAGSMAHAGTATAKATAPVEQYTRRIWRVQDGLPEDTVQAIQQSRMDTSG